MNLIYRANLLLKNENRIDFQTEQVKYLNGFWKWTEETDDLEALNHSMEESYEKIEEWCETIEECRSSHREWKEKVRKYEDGERKSYPYPKSYYFDRNKGTYHSHLQWLLYWKNKYFKALLEYGKKK